MKNQNSSPFRSQQQIYFNRNRLFLWLEHTFRQFDMNPYHDSIITWFSFVSHLKKAFGGTDLIFM